MPAALLRQDYRGRTAAFLQTQARAQRLRLLREAALKQFHRADVQRVQPAIQRLEAEGVHLVDGKRLGQRFGSIGTCHDVGDFRVEQVAAVCADRGIPVAFLPGDDAPKYFNNGETPLYAKSTVLYGIEGARGAIQRADRTIVVEAHEAKSLAALLVPPLRKLLFELDRVASAGDKAAVRQARAAARKTVGKPATPEADAAPDTEDPAERE